MNLTKIISRKHIAILGGLVILYLIINSVFIKQLPIFTDEAIYVRWTQIAANDASLRYISLVDGKQPLPIWIGMLPVKIFADSLTAMRLMSVIYGLFSLFGIYLLGRLYKNSSAGLIAATLFCISPFFFIYNRLALYESLISTIGVFSLLLITLMVRFSRTDLAMLLGFVIGLGMLTKSSANFFLYLMPFSLLTLAGKKSFPKLKEISWIFTLFALSAFIAFLMFNTLRLFPLFNTIGQKDHTFILTYKEFFQNPLYLVFGNTPSLVTWAVQYMTVPVSLLLVFAFFYYIYKRQMKVWFLFIWILVPFITTAFFGKIIYPRYILYLFPAIFIIISYLTVDIFSKTRNKFFKYLFLFILFATPIISIISIMVNPATSFIPDNDKNQLVNDWPAGGGVAESVEIIRNSAKTEAVFVGTEGTFGLMPYALEIELVEDPNVKIKGYYPVKEIPEEVLRMAKLQKTYFIYNLTQDESIFADPRFKLVGKFRKGNSETFLRIFEIK